MASITESVFPLPDDNIDKEQMADTEVPCNESNTMLGSDSYSGSDTDKLSSDDDTKRKTLKTHLQLLRDEHESLRTDDKSQETDLQMARDALDVARRKIVSLTAELRKRDEKISSFEDDIVPKLKENNKELTQQIVLLEKDKESNESKVLSLQETSAKMTEGVESTLKLVQRRMESMKGAISSLGEKKREWPKSLPRPK